MDSTSLDALFPPPGGAPQSAPPLPSSTTYTPVVTPGTMQYSAPQMSASSMPPTPYVKHILRSIVQYFAVFLAGMILSMPSIQSLGLRYVNVAYTSGGILSLSGAAIVGAAIMVLSYILSSVLTPILV